VFFKNKLLFVMQNLEIWGLMGTGDKTLSSKVPYLESPTMICLFTMQLLWGYGSLLFSIPIVKRFRSKKLSPVLDQNLTVFSGINRGLKLNLSL